MAKKQPAKKPGKPREPKGRGKPAKAKDKGGRLTDYNLALAALICDRLSDGESLKAICTDPAMPGRSTVFQWLALHPEFADMYARAREEQAETMAAEIVGIADEEKYEKIEVEGVLVGVRFDSTAVSRNKLRVDARKWVAAKLKPRVYGDKVQLADAEGNKLPPAPQFILAPVAPGPAPAESDD